MNLIIFLLGFTVGERIEYEARFSFLSLGSMTLEVRDTIACDDVPCYHISAVLTSARGLRMLFSIDDTIEVHTSREGLLPHFYRERINESGYRRANDLVFDRDSNFVSYNDTSRITITPETRDMLSFWYYLRTVPLVDGDTFEVDIHSGGADHRVECRVGPCTVVRTRAGDFTAIRVQPMTEGKGIFGSRGTMEIWYSLEERLPVQIRASMKVGSVLFRLKEVAD